MNTKFDEYLNSDGQMILAIIAKSFFGNIGDNDYAEICGSWIEGVMQWFWHNIDYIETATNANYTAFKFVFGDDCGISKERAVFIQNWVLNIEPKNWGHTKALFKKYVKEHTRFNDKQREKEQNIYKNFVQ